MSIKRITVNSIIIFFKYKDKEKQNKPELISIDEENEKIVTT